MERTIPRPAPLLVASVGAVVLFLVGGWLTFGVNWHAVLPYWPPFPFPAPTVPIAIVGPLLLGGWLALRERPRRSVGCILVVVGVIGAGLAVGTIGCLGYGGGYGVPIPGVRYNGDVLRFGYRLRCRADPSELGLFGAFVPTALGVFLLLDGPELSSDGYPSLGRNGGD